MASPVLHEYQILLADADRKKYFESSALNDTDGKRLYRFSTNIKTFETYYTYINDIYNKSTYSSNEKQKHTTLDKAIFRNYYHHNDIKYIHRSDIVLKAKSFFQDKRSPYLKLIIWILLLKETDESGKSYIFNNCSELWGLLSDYVRNKMFNYISMLRTRDSYNPDNIAYNSVLLYGDADLLNTYSRCIDNNIDITDFTTTIANEMSGTQPGSISERIFKMQHSSIKEELKYLYVFYLLNNVIKSHRINHYKNYLKDKINGNMLLREFVEAIERKGSIQWLGENTNGMILDSFRNFVLNPNNDPQCLSQEDRNELIDCIKFAF